MNSEQTNQVKALAGEYYALTINDKPARTMFFLEGAKAYEQHILKDELIKVLEWYAFTEHGGETWEDCVNEYLKTKP